jgi:nitrogen fixation protein NifQ
VLTATLGLPEADFLSLCTDYFPGEPLVLQDGPGKESLELDDIHQLLLGNCASTHVSEQWLARILAYACCGRDHLWQDLGLANRGELSTLMTLAFPTLAVLNVGDMKWKKFIYRHYCSLEGIYLCPAPSCGECTDHAKCYAPEE